MVKIETKQNPSLIESMFQAGAHFGYSKTRRHPSFQQVLFGSKNRIDIIDLEKTGTYLNTAVEYVKESVKNGKNILFVGTKPEARKIMEEVVVPAEVPYVMERWVGGTLTNLSEMRKRIARLEELQGKKERGELDVYTKKERLLFDRETEDLLRKFGGVVTLKQLPSIVCVIDPKHEETAVQEALRKKIPVIALAGSDCDISNIAYPIPANDSSLLSIRFFLNKIMEAYTEGLRAREIKVETPNAPDVPNPNDLNKKFDKVNLDNSNTPK